jgi:hypothetical protein
MTLHFKLAKSLAPPAAVPSGTTEGGSGGNGARGRKSLQRQDNGFT